MRSLFLGNIDDTAKEVIKYFDKQTGKNSNDIYKRNKLDYEKLFFAKEYDTIFYFAENVDNFDDLSNFISAIFSSNNVKKYIYVVRSNGFNLNSNNKNLNMIREVLDSYARKENKNIIVLNVSCIYGKDFIEGEINNINKNNSYDKEVANYIHIDDFSHFLYLLSMHKVNINYIELKATSSFYIEELIAQNVTQEFKENLNLPFEWSQIHSISNEKNIDKLIKNKNNKNINQPFIKFFEIIILFCVFEIFNNTFFTTLHLQSVDFRLIFVVVAAIYYDFKYSIFATLLAIISFLYLNVRDIYDISILANTDNWIAIMTYLLMTVVIRSRMKRFEIDNKTAGDRVELLEKQNKFKDRNLKKYEIRIKELNKAIIVHNQSFSKLENIINKYKDINMLNLYELFTDALDTKNIVVFEVNDGIIKNPHTDSNIVTDYLLEKKTEDFITTNDIWVNNDLDKRLPLYIVPVYDKDKLGYLVSIWDYEINIVNHDYRNNLVSLAKIASLLKENEK